MSEPLSVLQILKGLDIGGASGGSDKYGLELSLALQRSGARVAVACFNRFATPTEQQNLAALKAAGIPTLLLRPGNTFLSCTLLSYAHFAGRTMQKLLTAIFPSVTWLACILKLMMK